MVTNAFMEAVQAGNKIRVRIMLKDSLLLDPTSGRYDEMESYAANRLSDLFDVHDDEKLNYDRTAWNEDYLNQEMVTVVNNFSRERIDLLKSMVRALYPEKAKKVKAEQAEERNQEMLKMSRKQVGTGTAAAGAVVTAAGICTSHALLAVGGAALVAVGVAMIVTDREKDS